MGFTGALVASFTDANPNAKSNDFAASVDWGDKTPLSPGSILSDLSVPGRFDVYAGKYSGYADEGIDAIKVTIIDAGGSTATANGSANVIDAPLKAQGTIIGAVTSLLYSGVVATFTDADPFAKASDFAATINWGNGQTTNGIIQADAIIGGFVVAGSHTFGSAGPYRIDISIKDVGGSSAQATSTAQVGGYTPGQIRHDYGFDRIKFTGSMARP